MPKENRPQENLSKEETLERMRNSIIKHKLDILPNIEPGEEKDKLEAAVARLCVKYNDLKNQ